jgi:hypothetical protein
VAGEEVRIDRVILVTRAKKLHIYKMSYLGATLMVIGRSAASWRRSSNAIENLRRATIARISPPMRRIPRPSRAIDPSHPLSASIRQRVSPLPCRTSAAFSTTAPQSFLLPGKQDKKKHQQFVRRWQKRLLGDSEPIGAHVDPYDPTSPVRIAPEEQGEYEEVLEEDAEGMGSKNKPWNGAPFPVYTPAETKMALDWVGGDAWRKQKVEKDMAKEFEKLTLRTYTPLTLDMADEIEELTGTPYTLRDDNLMMAQTVHEVTRRPYTDYNFGLHGKVRTPAGLRNRFTQAVAEVYALKQAGLDMDVSKFPNRGVYDPPRWVQDIRLVKTDSGDLALEFPKYKSLEQFLDVMDTAPEWEGALAEEEELLVEEVEDLLDPVLPEDQLPPPTMDPDTPAFKRAAVVKMEEGKKPFDFMSNRPVPRAKPVEEPVAEAVVAQEPVVEEVVVQETAPATTSPTIHANGPAPVHEFAPAAATGSRHSILEQSAQQLADDFAALRKSAQRSKSSGPASSVDETKWRKISLDDMNVKFAVSSFVTVDRQSLTSTALQTPLPAHWPSHLRSTSNLRTHPR